MTDLNLFVFRLITDEATKQPVVLLTDGADYTSAHTELGYYTSTGWVDRDGAALTFTPVYYSLVPELLSINNRL